MEEPFRVVIVGGGLIGLLSAHILSRAGIQYVVLEQRAALVGDGGASIGLHPQTARIFDQLGLLEAIQRIWSPLSRKIVITHAGAKYKDHPRFDWMRENHGHPFAMIHRAELVQTLYETLPPSHQERIKTSKQVVDITTSDRRVAVHCSDNSIEYGSMVIGADGVASQVRHLMKNIPRGSDPSPEAEDEATQFPASFSLLYGAAPVLPGMPVSTSWEAHGTGMATALFVGTQKAWFFWYERLPLSTDTIERYSKVDEASFVDRWAQVYVTDEITLKDVYDARLSSGMTLVEEGMATGDWHRNRIVLVGDAAVKVSPNLAFGFNGGLQGLVSLANGLHRLLYSAGDSVPSTADLDKVFRAYQSETKPITTKLFEVSGQSLRVISWETWGDWLDDRFLSGATGRDWKRYNEDFAPLISRSLVLSFLEEKNMPPGRMSWLRHPDMGVGCYRT